MVSDTQKEIMERMKVSPTIDPEEEIRRTVDFMKDYLKKQPFLESYVLGISGGQDSTLLGKLAQKAVEELRAETKKDKPIFIAVRLPYGEQRDEDEAMKAIEWMMPDQTYHVDIKGQVDSLVDVLANQGLPVNDFNKGNIKARERMVAQYAIAGEFNGVVLGSDHSAENVTGFFTKHGDGASDLNPLFRLNKRQGRQMLEYLDAPENLYKKIPTADLEDNKPGLSDEDKLGVSYEVIDDYLEGKQVSDKDQQTIEDWFKKTEHKRHLPVTIFDDFWK
mgnify:CR=1 FL=1